VKGNPTLLLWRHGTCQLKSLLIIANSRMVAKKHVLEDTQCGWMQVGIPGIAKMVIIISSILMILRVRNPKLGPDRILACRWQKRP
jgi:hypothetical protein